MRRMILLLLFFLAFLSLVACQPGMTPGEGSTGDPPLIPHEVDAADSGEDCLGCHKAGDDGAPIMPAWHATLVDCRQCHVPDVGGNAEFMPKY